MDKTIPSAALLARRVRCGNLVEAIVRIVGMPGNESMFSPPGESRFVDVEAHRGFAFCQHSAISQSIIARAQTVPMGKIRYPQSGEASIVAAAPR